MWKILWEKEKLLITSSVLLGAIFPSPTGFSKDFYCRHVKRRVCLGDSITQQNFRLVQIESIGIQKNKWNKKFGMCFVKGRKHCWKRRKR